MSVLLILFFGQCVFAVAAVFVLKKALDRELIRAALEKFESCKPSADIKEIAVYSASAFGAEFRDHLESIRQRKFSQASLIFRENAALKGGVVITVGEILLDFSLSNRLQNLWS